MSHAYVILATKASEVSTILRLKRDYSSQSTSPHPKGPLSNCDLARELSMVKTYPRSVSGWTSRSIKALYIWRNSSACQATQWKRYLTTHLRGGFSARNKGTAPGRPVSKCRKQGSSKRIAQRKKCQESRANRLHDSCGQVAARVVAGVVSGWTWTVAAITSKLT